ncbi:MAG: sigma-70 family RNA polymerase sigma factor [Ktedonobacteraceae bacterium]|nr:sigma-70 family RNA polymerase sigma factor [Ktedonobacteraceae bacterium]
MMHLFKRESFRKQQNSPEARIGDEMSDEALIAAIANKTVWAMELLYQRYHRMLYAFVYHIVANQQVAEDLLQDAFFSVWQKAATYSPLSGEVRSWLISIVHHRAIDYLRGLQRRAAFTQVPLEQIDLTEGTATPDVWDEAWQSIQRDLVREALMHLPREQRMVIELAYFRGWTHSEIAEGCRLPLGTVKARMRLGLLHLKRLLENKELRASEQ